MNKNDKQQELQPITTTELEHVTGGFLPLVAAGVTAAATVGYGIWHAGHEKGVANSDC
jgi:lactobin A/cerein 7B family class IIb bacteriocin